MTPGLALCDDCLTCHGQQAGTLRWPLPSEIVWTENMRSLRKTGITAVKTHRQVAMEPTVEPDGPGCSACGLADWVGQLPQLWCISP